MLVVWLRPRVLPLSKCGGLLGLIDRLRQRLSLSGLRGLSLLRFNIDSVLPRVFFLSFPELLYLPLNRLVGVAPLPLDLVLLFRGEDPRLVKLEHR